MDELQEIEARWKLAIEFLDVVKDEKISQHLVDHTIPAKDIRYLLNRLKAAERAAKSAAAIAKMYRDQYDALLQRGEILPEVKESYVEHLHEGIRP